MVVFALLIVFAALIVVFSKEIGESSKYFWTSVHFRNLGLLLFASVFAIRYQYPIYLIFYVILHYWKVSVWFVYHLLNRFEGAEDFAMIFFLFCFTYLPVILIKALYFTIKRKKLPYQQSYVWFIWISLIAILMLA